MLNTTLLNEQQSAAVHFGLDDQNSSLSPAVISPPLLIIAGAGTGKTNTLAHRTAQLILSGVSPERILLMTFARRAAGELSSRANRIVEQQSRKDSKHYQPINISWMGTFHSIANRLLRIHGKSIGLESDFVIMDRGDSADLLDMLRHELEFTQTDKRFPKKNTCLNIYSKCINSQQDIADILRLDFPYCREWESELKQLFSRYTQSKIDQLCLDYDDLLLYCYHLAKVPDIAAIIRAQFDYILVDEYQDTNLLQAGILTGLFPTGEGVTVVGDDAQSIYSFRSATVDNILQFPDLFSPRATVISLTQNYRSHQHILDLSNALLSEGDEGYKVALYSDNKSGDKPKLVTVADDTKQAEYIVEQVLAARESGVDLKQQAVLFRSSYHSDRLELELTRRNIPFVKHGGLKFLEASHVKDLLGILRWADNPKFSVSAFRVLKLLPGVGPKIADKTLQHLELNQFDIHSLSTWTLPSAAQALWEELSALLIAIHDDAIPWHDQVNKAASCYQSLLEINYDDHFVRFGDVEQLAQISQQFPTRERFLSELTLDPPQTTGDLAGTPHIDDDFLILSTVHSAKGQEWKNVHILNVADGNFPNEYSAGDDRAIEEERRLLNVAITRAKNEVHLIQPLKYWIPEQQKNGDKHVYGGKSRFLTENIMPLLECTHYPCIERTPEEIAKGQQVISDIREKLLCMWD
ncbi:ATP-dependent DNA helicase [Gammaproteobacteria bacterium 45_16_T64]|nr:ATP-dependent DNA helicase [Gammaproteobacteria bacterium 45_16_T64]